MLTVTPSITVNSQTVRAKGGSWQTVSLLLLLLWVSVLLLLLVVVVFL